MIINRYRPDEFYNLGAQSHVKTSFDQPSLTFNINAVGVLNVLEAIRHFSPHTKFYQASTSEMFGSNYSLSQPVGPGGPVVQFQDENTPFSPNSPYAVSKVAAHSLVSLYRRSYNIHASAGILFNHESERRGEEFVTRKITKYVARLDEHLKAHGGLFPKLMLGNLDAVRDWGYAPDYIEAMWLMLQQPKADDYVICTGEAHTIRDFLDAAFGHIGIDDWTPYVGVDPQFYRPCEVEYLKGSCEKAKKILGWSPKVTFKELAARMVEHDKKLL